MCRQLHNKMQSQLIYHFRVMKARRIRKCRTRDRIRMCTYVRAASALWQGKTQALQFLRMDNSHCLTSYQWQDSSKFAFGVWPMLTFLADVPSKHKTYIVWFSFVKHPPHFHLRACTSCTGPTCTHSIRQRSIPSGHKNSNLEIWKYHARELLRCDAALYRT